jgi:hypothetical protein
MLVWAIDLIRVHRAKRAATSRIAPLVDGSKRRLGGIPESAWCDPYLIGFTIMLITIAAKSTSDRLEGDALCLTQEQAWKCITCRPFDSIGERVLLLSRDNNPDFARGCQTARELGSFLDFDQPDSTPLASFSPSELDERDAFVQIWISAFDAHIQRFPAGQMITPTDQSL